MFLFPSFPSYTIQARTRMSVYIRPVCINALGLRETPSRLGLHNNALVCVNMSSFLFCRELTLISINFGLHQEWRLVRVALLFPYRPYVMTAYILHGMHLASLGWPKAFSVAIPVLSLHRKRLNICLSTQWESKGKTLIPRDCGELATSLVTV